MFPIINNHFIFEFHASWSMSALDMTILVFQFQKKIFRILHGYRCQGNNYCWYPKIDFYKLLQTFTNINWNVKNNFHENKKMKAWHSSKWNCYNKNNTNYKYLTEIFSISSTLIVSFIAFLRSFLCSHVRKNPSKMPKKSAVHLQRKLHFWGRVKKSGTGPPP